MRRSGTWRKMGTSEPVGAGRGPRVVLRMFAAAREAAGTGRQEVEASTVGAVIAEACARYGAGFAAVASVSQIWVNGDPADADRRLSAGDEVAILPPVSGGV